MLGNWKVLAEEAKRIGVVVDVVIHNDLMQEAQCLAERWVQEGWQRTLPGGENMAKNNETKAIELVIIVKLFL